MKRSILFTAVSLKGEARKQALGCVDCCCSHISQRVQEQMMKGQCKMKGTRVARVNVVIAETVRMRSLQRR